MIRQSCIFLLFMALVACTRSPTIVLDSGHNPAPSPLGSGAISATGKNELEYNDVFVSELQNALTQAGYTVVLTRTPQQSITLDDRASIANHVKNAIFISIHHDSTQLDNLKAIDIDGKTAYQTLRPIIGTSLHISQYNGDYENSKKLATSIGQEFYTIKRTINLDHANPKYSQPLALSDERLGIYHHDNLRVLKSTAIPAVLIEIGVIVDKADESWLSTPSERTKMVDAIVRGVQHFDKSR